MEIREADFEDVVLKSDRPVLVDFMASWCPPCKMMQPVVDRLAAKVADWADVYSVNIDRNAALAARYEISGVPTFVAWAGGQIAGRVWNRAVSRLAPVILLLNAGLLGLLASLVVMFTLSWRLTIPVLLLLPLQWLIRHYARPRSSTLGLRALGLVGLLADPVAAMRDAAAAAVGACQGPSRVNSRPVELVSTRSKPAPRRRQYRDAISPGPRGARDAGAAGFSLYNLETTSVADWGAIDVFRGTAP